MTRSEPLKILQVTKLYTPWIGGVERIVQELSEGLRNDSRFDVRVLCVASRGAGSSQIINGVPVRRSASFGILFGMPLSLSFFLDFRRAVSEVDIIHFHEPFPLATLAWFFFRPRKKIIVTYHADIVRQRILFPLYRPFLFSLLRAASFISPTSPVLQSYSLTLSHFPEKLRPIPLGIPLRKFSHLTERHNELLGKLKERYGAGPFILFAGRPAYYKGIPTLFEAFRGIPARLILVGVSECDVTIPSAIHQRLIFTGKVSDEDLPAYYHFADFFVLPSTKPAEAFGLVQVEAMAAGLPVINTALPTAVPWVSRHNETGLTVEPGNVSELRGAILTLLTQPKLRESFACTARERANLFSSDRMISDYAKLYESLF